MACQSIKKATFAGGCFWCMVKPFDEMEGILDIRSGYTGGKTEAPVYEDVKTGETGHYEAVQITYDENVFPYEKLLNLYWPQIDPTDDGGQFFDRGSQYRTAIFYHDKDQKQKAEQSKSELKASGRFQNPIVTQILPAAPFYEAEEHHQKFHQKKPEAYEQERRDSGRDDFIYEYWQ
ncbi:peptide-methionine (S)-S-oxide reductase [Salisediminibacterium halotolerans]|nr:peptide-methionine (S)-S-oxide reductase [Actinophytocola xinjiangensis]RPE87888.1 peptide-methionine (S)-S-oxide reductase [Salisediminibacterium halotolerans]TWG37915.1 peptide-methionine (S)-S-oxide reductase [Salisediminibacterium halotolerans]GEL08260.1 peptide methionine sulfoxide reductase MsrA [Salisediminibacterium halotolerans]